MAPADASCTLTRRPERRMQRCTGTWGYSRVTLGGGLDVLGKGSGSLGVLGKGEEGPRTASPAAELGRQEGRAGAAARHRGEVARLGQRHWRSRKRGAVRNPP
jgi:hypothetical protein